MKRKNPKPIIHENTNRKVARVLRDVKRETGVWNQREVARRLDVNPKYININLRYGIEPPDSTAEGRETRVKMFMSERRKKIKLMVACPRCGQVVSEKLSGQPRAHFDQRGKPCGATPKPLWQQRLRAIPKNQRDSFLEFLFTDQYKWVVKWIADHQA